MDALFVALTVALLSFTGIAIGVCMMLGSFGAAALLFFFGGTRLFAPISGDPVVMKVTGLVFAVGLGLVIASARF